MKKPFSLASFALIVASASLFGSGCNPLQTFQDKVEKTVTEKASEVAVGAMTGGKVSMDSDTNNFLYKDNKTGNTVSIGENVKLPEDLTKALPIYPGSVAKSVSVSKVDDKETAVTLRTEDDQVKVAVWYSETLKKQGWSEESSTTMGASEARSYKKGNQEISLLVFPVDEQGKGSLATLVYKPGEEVK